MATQKGPKDFEQKGKESASVIVPHKVQENPQLNGVDEKKPACLHCLDGKSETYF